MQTASCFLLKALTVVEVPSAHVVYPAMCDILFIKIRFTNGLVLLA